MTHAHLWNALASAYPSLLAVTNGERTFSTVLAAAIVVWWSPSAWRCLAGRRHEGDHRYAFVRKHRRRRISGSGAGRPR